MYFELKYYGPPERTIKVISPAHFYGEADREGWDTSTWEGKANSFVERRGIHPSYGHFIISGSDAEYLMRMGALQNPNKDTVNYSGMGVLIYTEEIDPNTGPIIQEFKGLIISQLEAINPTMDGNQAFYYIKLVDFRATIRGTENEYPTSNILDEEMYFNLTESCLTKKELQDKYGLTSPPSFSEFLYLQEDALSYWNQNASVPTQPSGGKGYWKAKDLVKEILQYIFISNTVVWPQNYVPPEFTLQNINIHPNDGDVASVIEQILFFLGIDLIFEFDTTNIKATWTVVEVGDNYLPSDQQSKAYFEDNTSFDQQLTGYMDKLIDKKHLVKDMDIPKSIEFCYPYLSKDNNDTREQLYRTNLVDIDYPSEKQSFFLAYVEAPVSWSLERKADGDLPASEKHDSIDDWTEKLLKVGNNGFGMFYEYPPKSYTFSGFQDFYTGNHIARIAWYDLGNDSAGTVVQNIIPWRWNKLAPKRVPKDTQQIIYGTTVEKVNTETKKFELKDIVTVAGPAPSSTTMEVRNTSKASIESGTIVFCLFNEHLQEWETITTTGSSNEGTASKVIRFKLKEDKERKDTYAEAWVIDENNNLVDASGDPVGTLEPWAPQTPVEIGTKVKAPIQDPIQSPPRWVAGDTIESIEKRDTGSTFDSQEASKWKASTAPEAKEIIVTDPEGKFYGYAAFTDPQFGAQSGYNGTAFFVKDDFNDTGKPAYQILDIESTARWIEGLVAKDPDDADRVYYPSWEPNTNIPPFHKVICPPGGYGGLVAGDIIISIADGSRVSGPSWNSAEAENWKKFADGNLDYNKYYFYLSVDKYWGAFPNNRPPKTTEISAQTYEDETYYVVKVYCTLGEPIPREGDQVRALYDDDFNIYILDKISTSYSHIWARVVEEITEASSQYTDDWGSGKVKFQDPVTGEVKPSIRDVDNLWIGTSFPVDSQVLVDATFDPPRVLNGTCANVSWSSN